MKRFTKLFMTLALLCVAGSVSAQETDGCATFANPGKTNAEWVPSSSSFKWGAASWNQIHNIGLLADETNANSDISNLKTLTIDYKILSGNGFRVLFYQGGSNIALYINASGAYRNNDFSGEVAATVDGVVEIPIYDFLSNANGYSTDYMFKLSDICLSGFGGSGEVQVNSMCVSTYGPDDEKPQIIADEEEQDPGKPAGDFIDFTEAFSSLTPILKVKRGQGEFVIGQKTQDVVADLSAYSKLTIVATPGLKLVLYMNHEINPRENAGEYTEEEAGKYVFLEVQANEDGIAEVDLTQYAKQDLNCICLPWDNSNKGTVWYLLLTENEDPLAFAKNELSKAIAQGEAMHAFGKTEDSFGALTAAISEAESALENATTAEELESAKQAIEDAISGLTIADGYTALTQEMFKNWTAADATAEESGTPGFESHLGAGINAGATLYGDGNVHWSNFADLSDYGMIYFVGNPGVQVRCLFNRAEDPENKGALVEKIITVNEEGVAEFDLTTLTEGYAHLNSVKIPWNGSTGNIITDILLTELSSIPVTIGEAGYATFCSKKAVALETGMEAYAVEYNGSSAQLIPVEGAVDANTPVILKADADDYELEIVESAASPDKNDLKVSDGNVAGNGSIYVLANGSHDVGFYLLAEGVKIPAGKAYLEVNAGGREFIGFGDATGIKSVETVKANGTVYNLAGQQVKNAQKGVFIVNGKKVIK